MHKLRQATNDDIPVIYGILLKWPDVWEKDYNEISYYDFTAMFLRDTVDSLVVENERGILFWAYTTLVFPGGWSDIVVVRDPDKFSSGFINICQEGFDLLFSKHDLKLIRAFVRFENANAVKMLETLEFSLEGKLKAFRKIGDQWSDYLVYGLMREDRFWAKS